MRQQLLPAKDAVSYTPDDEYVPIKKLIRQFY